MSQRERGEAWDRMIGEFWLLRGTVSQNTGRGFFTSQCYTNTYTRFLYLGTYSYLYTYIWYIYDLIGFLILYLYINKNRVPILIFVIFI